MNGMILKSIAGTLILGLALWGPGVGLAMAQVAELAGLKDWDPGFHAAMEALVEADPAMNDPKHPEYDPELRSMCIDLAVDARTNPGVQADLAREAEVMSRQGVDPKTVVSEEVRAKTQEIYTQWKGEMSAKMEQLRRTDPGGARKLEFQLREGERQMTAFQGGERYVPSSEMRTHAQETFNQWEKDALRQGISKEALTAARIEFERWSHGPMGMGGPMGGGDHPAGMGRMPENVHYNEKGQLMVMDPKTGISKQWDRATMGEPPVPMGQPSYERGRVGPSGDMRMPSGDPATWTEAQRAQYEAMRTSPGSGGPMSQADMEAMWRESMARQHLGGGWTQADMEAMRTSGGSGWNPSGSSGWDSSAGGGTTTYSGDYSTSGTSGTYYSGTGENQNYHTAQEGQHNCADLTAESKALHQAHGHCPNE